MSKIHKEVLDPTRIRIIPKTGFSWIDRRFLRDGFADTLSGPELLLYWFLCSVADRQGLSFYSEQRACKILKLIPQSLDRAKRNLIRKQLICYRAPLYQVLALPDNPMEDASILPNPVATPGVRRPSRSEPRSMGAILEDLL
jgi:hypothetical protein